VNWDTAWVLFIAPRSLPLSAAAVLFRGPGDSTRNLKG
jgi:hypothetical protein